MQKKMSLIFFVSATLACNDYALKDIASPPEAGEPEPECPILEPDLDDRGDPGSRLGHWERSRGEAADRSGRSGC